MSTPYCAAVAYNTFLSLISTSPTRTFLRYFGHHTMWYLRLKTAPAFLLYLLSVPNLMLSVCHTYNGLSSTKRAYLPPKGGSPRPVKLSVHVRFSGWEACG